MSGEWYSGRVAVTRRQAWTQYGFYGAVAVGVLYGYPWLLGWLAS